MLTEANGETRKHLALAFATAIAVAAGTKLAEWAVERVRERYSKSPSDEGPTKDEAL